MKPKYFFTKNTPHQWSSGPNIYTFNNEFQPISSLEEAKSLAENARRGYPGQKEYTETTYGVMYDTDPLEKE